MTAVLPKRGRSLYGLGTSRMESSVLRDDHLGEAAEPPRSCRARERERERER